MASAVPENQAICNNLDIKLLEFIDVSESEDFNFKLFFKEVLLAAFLWPRLFQ